MDRSGLDVFFPFYHSVTNQVLPHTVHLYSHRNRAQFEADLDHMLDLFEPIKLSELLKGEVREHRSRPFMVLSFDDGLIQCYDEIRPVLLKKGIPATFFLNNDFIDNKAMFFRFKVSLLLEQLRERKLTEKTGAASILHCSLKELRTRLMSLSYEELGLIDRLAEFWNYSFEDYLSENPVYMSSRHIREMKQEGFEIGSHGFDHPMFSLLPVKECINHIRQSTEDLQIRFGMDYRYFAFPFTDFGIRDEVLDELFRSGIIDAGFGSAGLKEDKWENYFQRVPMEFKGLAAKNILRGELNRRRVRRMMGKNMTAR